MLIVWMDVATVLVRGLMTAGGGISGMEQQLSGVQVGQWAILLAVALISTRCSFLSHLMGDLKK